MSTFTTNKNIQEPASGSFNNAWATPVNANWSIIDEAFGGTTAISLTGVVNPSNTLTITQYTPPNIEFSGTMTLEVAYFVPAGVGGIWSVANNTTGAFLLVFGYASGSYQSIPQGTRTLFIGDGTNMQIAHTNIPAVNESAVLAWQAALAIQGSQIQSVIPLAWIPSVPASQVTSGVFAAARIPPPASQPGVTIQADPGTTPTGTFGQIFYYY